jgi:hypothetical protein
MNTKCSVTYRQGRWYLQLPLGLRGLNKKYVDVNACLNSSNIPPSNCRQNNSSSFSDTAENTVRWKRSGYVTFTVEYLTPIWTQPKCLWYSVRPTNGVKSTSVSLIGMSVCQWYLQQIVAYVLFLCIFGHSWSLGTTVSFGIHIFVTSTIPDVLINTHTAHRPIEFYSIHSPWKCKV